MSIAYIHIPFNRRKMIRITPSKYIPEAIADVDLAANVYLKNIGYFLITSFSLSLNVFRLSFTFPKYWATYTQILNNVENPMKMLDPMKGFQKE